jgi:hypothetical protein
MHCYDDAPPRDNPKESVDEPVNGVAAVHWCLRVWTTKILGTVRVELYMGKHESVDPSQNLYSKRTRSPSLLRRCPAVDYLDWVGFITLK